MKILKYFKVLIPGPNYTNKLVKIKTLLKLFFIAMMTELFMLCHRITLCLHRITLCCYLKIYHTLITINGIS